MINRVAYFATLHAIQFLLEHELIPRRDFGRAASAIKKGLDHDLKVETSGNPALHGLIFREGELNGWNDMSEEEQRRTMTLANQRRSIERKKRDACSQRS